MATVRTATYFAEKFITDYVPTQADFEDLFASIPILGDDRGGIPLKKFGISMQDYTDPDVDQLTAFQAAVNSAAGAGDYIIMPGGKLVLDGLLQVPTPGGFVGQTVGNMYRTHIKLADGANTGLIACNDPNPNSTGNGTGGLANIIANLMFNGNGANNSSYTGPLIYSYSGATSLTNQSDFQNVLGQPRNFVDPRRVWEHLYIVDAPDIGFETDGRGESRYFNIFCRESLGTAFKFGSFDEFACFLTAAGAGGAGFEFATGAAQFRLLASKAYFTGKNAARDDGDGFVCTAGGVQNLQIIGCTAQDTHRHGFNLLGTMLTLSACQCESIGTLYPVFGMGSSTLNSDIAAVRTSALKNSQIQVAIADRQAAAGSGTAYCEWALDMRSNTQLCEFNLTYGTEGTYVEVANELRTNNLSAGMRNWVKCNGKKIHGYAFTQTELRDATHAVNTVGAFDGLDVIDKTNRQVVIKSGTGATDPWYAAGASVHTPV